MGSIHLRNNGILIDNEEGGCEVYFNSIKCFLFLKQINLNLINLNNLIFIYMSCDKRLLNKLIIT